ncbi:MAG: hypothetical protein JWO67_4532 [Streptosporangiaceae bacterium]|nr:hypothetical protein [Streptosporangiaceae bacterium]
MAYQLSAAQIASHLRWLLSNSNHEIEPDDGPFLDVAFDAWDVAGEPGVVSLVVQTRDADTRESGVQGFLLTVAPGESDKDSP